MLPFGLVWSLEPVDVGLELVVVEPVVVDVEPPPLPDPDESHEFFFTSGETRN